jgi:hypothetical protein
MATVKSMLPKVKATSLTYYNLDKRTVDDFKKLYSYLKKNENKDVGEMAIRRANEMLKEQGRYSDYVRKYKAMEILSTSIKH